MKLNSQLNIAALADAYRRSGKMHIAGLLDPADARRLYDDILAQQRWNFVINAHGRHIDLDAEGWRTMDAATRQKTESVVHERASKEFVYMHYKLSIYDRYHSGPNGGGLSPCLTELFEFLNGGEFLNFVRILTGAHDIAFADAQLTAFGPGHFVTIHNDDLEGKNRRAAFVLNMTPDWQEDWGGYLNFYDDQGHISAGFKPAFNALNIFTVPARHSVSVVAPFAQKLRYGISGWLRAGADPARR
jgi:Rps23 Pro-64 3,4-dihydroxylase Tpa1-like proline 4-hydroxylase